MRELNLYIIKPEEWKKTFFRLMESMIVQEKKAYILCSSTSEVEEIDRLLWSFSQLSFLPHGTTDDPHQEEQKILLGTVMQPMIHNNPDVLVLTKQTIILNDETTDLQIDLQIFKKYQKVLVLDPEMHSHSAEKIRDICERIKEATSDILTSIIEKNSEGKWLKNGI